MMMHKIITALVLGASTAQELRLDDAIATIRADVVQQEAAAVEATETCDLATSSCPLSEMSTTSSTQVFTGGETRCIYEDSSPYSFQVSWLFDYLVNNFSTYA
jgi:hypothetical protein